MPSDEAPGTGKGLGVRELSDKELKDQGVDLSKRGPRLEVPKDNPEIKARLQKLLAEYRAKVQQGLKTTEGSYQAPEVQDPYYYEAQYGADFLSQLLTDGHVDTYDFTRRIGKGLNGQAFGRLMVKVEDALGI